MKTITLNPGERLAAGQLPRQGVLPAAIMQSAQAIVDDVRERGDVALRDALRREILPVGEGQRDGLRGGDKCVHGCCN